MTVIEAAGSWLVAKLLRQQAESGTLAAARNAKKQGLPLRVTVAILAGRK